MKTLTEKFIMEKHEHGTNGNGHLLSNFTAITNNELRSKPEEYMEELSCEEKDDELEAGTLFDDF